MKQFLNFSTKYYLSLAFGWEAKENVYVPIMTLPVPLELMELSVCSGKTSHNTMRCKCIKNQFKCIDLCKCVSCKNNGAEFDVTVHDISSDVQL